MIDKGLKVGDYILITDNNDHWHYLQIGIIKSIDLYPNGTIKGYRVLFNLPDTCCGNIIMCKKNHIYGVNLSERCKVLCFKEEEQS